FVSFARFTIVPKGGNGTLSDVGSTPTRLICLGVTTCSCGLNGLVAIKSICCCLTASAPPIKKLLAIRGVAKICFCSEDYFPDLIGLGDLTLSTFTFKFQGSPFRGQLRHSA